MNTKSLQTQFRGDYEDFFARNDLVVSGCFTGPLAPTGVGHASKFMRIKFKLPIKMYIGMNKNHTNEINFRKVSIFNTAKSKFEDSEFHDMVDGEEQKISTFIKNFLQKHNQECGLDISILSEWRRWCSFSFSSTLAAVLATALYITIGKISHQDIEDYEEFIQSKIFHEIEVTAREIALFTRYGNSSWSAHVLAPWYAPGLFYCETFDSNIKTENVENLESSFTPLSTLFDIHDHNYLPFDYAIVFSWSPNNSQKIEQAIQLDERKFQKYQNFIDDKVLPITKLTKNVRFIQVLYNWAYNQFVDMFSMSTVMVLESLEKIYTEGEDIANIDHLIDTVNRIRYLFYMLEREPSDFIEGFTSYFGELSHNKEKIGMVNSYSSKIGWACMVIMKDWTNKKHFYETIEQLKTEYPDIELPYASRIDGISNEWIRIEQNISEKIFSNYIQKDKVFCKNNQGENFLWNYDELVRQHTDWLLLDMIDNKIHLNGKKLTSADLCSQTSTISILWKLLDNIGQEVWNKELEISSYSKNKNEMLGKIVIPLISLIEKETGERLPLICKWSIYDFYMKLHAESFKVSIIKKL